MLPKHIQKGDVLGIIAPSAPVREDNLEEFNQSILLMEASGYELKIGKNVFSDVTGYGASVEQKLEDIHYMFSSPEVKMVWCAKGGDNSNSLFEQIDYHLIAKNPKIICGYSDSTSLLNMIYQKTGLITFLGQTFKGLASCDTDYSYREIIKRFQAAKLELGTENDLYETIQEGEAEGILVGGNLNLISNLVSGAYHIDFQNKILFIEEFGLESNPGAVSRYLYHMKQNHVWDQIRGLWIGNYEHESGITLEKIVTDVLADQYHFPIIKSNNFGHTDRKTVIPIGTKARINTKVKEKIKLLENCVL